VKNFPKWYPVSISGYHISQAGSTPVQQAAYTLSNGFAYAEMMRDRGVSVDAFAPRFSFFFDCGVDVEFIALSRVCRKIWAIGIRDVFGGDLRAQRLKMHTQTSGRSLVSAEFKNNLTRTALEMVMAYMNATNSCHSNSADEPFTTPSEEYVKLASHGQAILLEESGLFRHRMNGLSGSPGMKAVERAVEVEILKEFSEIERLGGVVGAMEHRYQRSQIQASSYRYEQQILSGERRVIGLNRYAEQRDAQLPAVVRVADAVKLKQVERVRAFKAKNARAAAGALDDLSQVVANGGNVFTQLVETVEVCSLGQITQRLQRDVGIFRPMI
jgi:methylmalonyl-CoA mutase cobalamin-binding domain/chain